MEVRYYGSNGNVIVETDGNMQCAHFADFANVQESDCAFGGTDIDAVANLALAMRDAFPAGSPRILDAAPELLAALEAAREFIIDGMAMGFVGMPEDEDVLEVIEKAISKAKGTQQ